MIDLNKLKETLNNNYGTRLTYKQKLSASKGLYRLLEGFTVNAIEGKAKSLKLHHLVLNDIQRAKLLLMVPYDTPQKKSKNFKYYPFDSELNIKSNQTELKKDLVLSIGFGLLGFLFFYLSTQFLNTLMIIGMVLSFFGSFYFIRPRANKMNANRNTASMIMAIELASRYPEVGVIFVDKTTDSNLGYSFLNEAINDINQRTVLILDSVANGEVLLAQSTVPVTMKTIDSKDTLPFENCIKVSRVESIDHPYVKNTSSSLDSETPNFDESLVEINNLVESLLNV